MENNSDLNARSSDSSQSFIAGISPKPVPDFLSSLTSCHSALHTPKQANLLKGEVKGLLPNQKSSTYTLLKIFFQS